MFVSVWFSAAPLVPRPRTAAMLLAVALILPLAILRPPPAADAAPLSISALSHAELENILSGIPLKDLSAGQLSEVLANRLSGAPTGQLKETLERTVEGLAGKGDTLRELAGSAELSSELQKQLNKLPLLERASLETLLGVLSGHSLSTVLSEGLGTLDGREVVGALLKSASEHGQPVAPAQLIEQLLTAPSPEKLEQALGTSLTGEPFSQGTVEELANQVGTTAKGLAEDFDATTTQLPGDAMTLTTPLTNGKTLGVLDAVEGIDVGTLTHELTGGSGGSGGGSGGSGGGSGGSGGGSSGGTGGPGGTGGSGGASSAAPGSVTIINELGASSAIAPSPSASAKGTPAKVRILSRKAKGDAVTLVVQAPAAGTLTVDGRGLESVRKRASEAERLTVRTVLTKAEAALLRNRHRRLELTLDVSFKPVSGASSTAKTNVTVG